MKLPRRRQFLHLAAGAAALSASAARRVGAIVSDTAGAPDRRHCRRRRARYPRALNGSMAVGAARPAIRHREPAGRRQQYRHRGGRRAPPDGYTLLLCGNPNAINATFYDKLTYNFIRDIAPVASIVRIPLVMVVNSSIPAKTVPEFVAYAKAYPGKISFASGGNGTTPHVSGELFKMNAGVDMVHVPYRGAGPAMTDLLGGQVQVMFVGTPESIEQIRSGKLRALAVTTATRVDVLPDIPTLNEFVPGYEASAFWGIGAPKATPAEIVDKLNKEINAVLADPKMKMRLADFGGHDAFGSPADFGKLIADDTEKWRKVIRAANIKAE